MSKVQLRQVASLGIILTSRQMAGVLNGIAGRVLARAQQDPNPEYTASLRSKLWYSRGGGKVAPRLVAQVGASPIIGPPIEAKRATLTRALRGG